MSNFVQRTLTGLVFIIAVMGAALGGQWLLGALFLFFTFFGLYEFYQITQPTDSNSGRKWLDVIIGVCVFSLLFYTSGDDSKAYLLWFLIPVFVIRFCIELFRKEPKSISELAIPVFAWIYVAVPFAMLNALAHATGEYEAKLVIGFFLILWTNDTGAYLSGRMLGRTKLFERISPKKTWEGLAGGVILSMVVAAVISNYFTALELENWLVIAVIIAVFANLGDLFESYIKRLYGVKDSGKIIPGHGGVLDRFDGLLLSLPLVIAYLKIIEFI